MRSKARDKGGGTLDKLRGRMQEAGGALSGRSAATCVTCCESSHGRR
jgi:hypothetical protein